MFKTFAREYASHSNQNHTDDTDILAAAQHHGLPTRLLDWSENILAACYFSGCWGRVILPTTKSGPYVQYTETNNQCSVSGFFSRCERMTYT
jgi:hypothetical protein